MNITGKCKKYIMQVLALLMVVTALLSADIPVNAATSIRTSTVKTQIKASSVTALKISWTKDSLASGYAIYRRESVRKPYTRIRKVGAGSTSYLDKWLISGKPYQYAVRAYRRENGRDVYSKFTAVIGATRPSTTKSTIKAVSSSTINVSWNKVSRLDGYRIYRKASGGKWTLVADVPKTQTSYSDKKVSANTKYVYAVRPYKKGGSAKYMSAMRLSNQVTTPKQVNNNSSNSNSNNTVSNSNNTVSNSKFTASQKDVMKKILYAVETGGQVYGKQDYADFTKAYSNSSVEHAFTIGAGQWYETVAKILL